MRLWRWDLIFVFCLIFVACPLDECDSGAGPSPVTTTTVKPVPPLPPRVDAQPNLYDVRGCTAFGMAALTEPELTAFVYHAQAKGCNIFRVGAQTDGWAGHDALYQQAGLRASAGATVFSKQWELNLKQLLDVTSRIPGVYLQLIPTFTHKNEGLERVMRIIKEVVKIQQAGSDDDATPYKHIVWEAMNEYHHPISVHRERNVAKMLKYLKDKTGLPVGTDYPGTRRYAKWVPDYPEELLPLVDYVAFHPPRNDWQGQKCETIRPDYWQLRKMVRRYNKPVWLDETTCYISDASKSLYNIVEHGHYANCGRGTEAQRKKIIKDYMWDTEHAGAVWFTHALWLFECRNLGWLPQ